MAAELIYCFTIKVVGKGATKEEAWEDAKQGAEEKVADDIYDEAELIGEDEIED